MIEEKFLETKWGKLKYLTSGRFDQAIVFLHGMAGWPVFVTEMSEAFNQMGFSYFAPYLPGHGDSFPMPKGFSFSDLVKVMMEFLRQVKAKQIILVGHSLGGSICLGLLERKDLPVSGVVLVDCYPGGSRLHIGLRALPLFFLHYLVNKSSDYFSYWLRLQYWRSSGLHRGMKVNTKLYIGQFPAYWHLLDTIKFRASDRFDRLPVLVLWGENDDLVPIRFSERIFEGIRIVKKEIFAGRHYWFARNPESLILEVVKFAESVKLGKV